MTVRVAATGRAATPPLFETLAVLGKEVVRRRLRRAIEVLKTARPAAEPTKDDDVQTARARARRRDARLHPRDRRGRRAQREAHDRRHALPARAERLPARRPREVDLPELRRRPGVRRAAATCASTTRTRPRRSRSTSTPSRRTCAGSASTGGSTSTTRPTTSTSSTSGRSCSIRSGQGLRRRPHRGPDPRAPRHPDRAGQGQPLPRPHGRRRTSTSSARMRKGEFPDGARVLRAKIDMASRQHQPARPGDVPHPARLAIPCTGDEWCIYPSYDYAHGQSDAIEGITHSLCTLEFEDHRPLYDWFLENLPVPSRPRQIEFARLNLTYTVLSKRFLLRLVNEGRVRGWDDPRMPTHLRPAPPRLPAGGAAPVRGADRRGQARERRRVRGPRALRARRPQPHVAAAHGRAAAAASVVLTNYPEGQVEEFERRQQPRGPGGGHAQGARSRASSGSSATTSWRTRRRSSSASPPAARCACAAAYFITCQEVVKDAAGEVVELRCTYDPATRGGSAPDGRSPKATLHWRLGARTRCRRRCASTTTSSRGPIPGADGDLLADLNPKSEEVIAGALGRAEPRRRCPPARACSSSGWATSAWTRTRTPGAPGLQPHGDPAGHLGQGPGQRLGEVAKRRDQGGACGPRPSD